jgi:hypothetical protein
MSCHEHELDCEQISEENTAAGVSFDRVPSTKSFVTKFSKESGGAANSAVQAQKPEPTCPVPPATRILDLISQHTPAGTPRGFAIASGS